MGDPGERGNTSGKFYSGKLWERDASGKWKVGELGYKWKVKTRVTG
jgi:hypothetical protein